MKHILILISMVFLSNIGIKGQCIEPADTTVHVFKQLIIHGTHDNLFWSGDTLNILLEEIDHVGYDTIDHTPIFYNDPNFDDYIQCRLDSGATPHEIMNEYPNPDAVVHHLYGKHYAGGYIFHIDPSGGGLVTCGWNFIGNYQNTSSSISNISQGGFTDWYLPSRYELLLMYQNLHKKGLGWFIDGYYWSSTIFYPNTTPIQVYAIHFSGGWSSVPQILTTIQYHAQAIRKF